jgi:hypothetical protein
LLRQCAEHDPRGRGPGHRNRCALVLQRLPQQGDAQPIAGLDGVASLSVLNGAACVRIAVIGVSNVLGAEETLAKDALPRM